ncbi:MAG: nitroreductase family protein [Deltaproteobacteria bacterium]|jgi:5,6-dimethylbenzimidazole synthase
MEFKDVVKSRRSCRAFEPDPVPDDQLTAIMEAGQWAPSPMNALPWEYIIVTDAGVKTQIREVSEAAKEAVLDNGGPGFAAKYDMNFLEEAPVVITVVFDPAKKGLGDFFNQKHGALQAASACVQNMMLAAAEYGLGTLWFTWFDPQKMQVVLNIPENLEIAAIIPVGKPKGEIKAPPRKEAKTHQQRYTAAE